MVCGDASGTPRGRERGLTGASAGTAKQQGRAEGERACRNHRRAGILQSLFLSNARSSVGGIAVLCDQWQWLLKSRMR